MENKLLVFGASGFIGKNLSDFLLTDYHFETSSLRDLTNLDKINSADIVINLVGKAHDHKGEATERDFYYANYELVKNIYNVFIQSEASLFIHISSIAAIEESGSANALTEEMVGNPVSWYGKSKQKAEQFIMDQQLPDGKKIIILRPTMVHGPGDKGNLTLLYKLIAKGLPYPLSKFDNRRSFLSIDNFNYLIKEIINKHTMVPSGIYHICDDQPIATSTIISVIGEVTDKKIFNFPLPKGLVKGLAKFGDFIPLPLNSKRLGKMTSDLVVSNTKIKNALQIEQLPISAEEGLKRTIQSFSKL
ncbi:MULTISPECIES: NAD-dependent epimerase/dehydratase family protein [unclassified Myroides]|uniref:NAD-dependent epimerase/dehydratase family protein n=1 Tax=unclassified Myroides TaxID=2642485 RepID=UPI003D2F9157